MNMTCKVAMDLTELYKAHLVSAESAAEIRAHLRSCPACRRHYKEYDALRGRIQRSHAAQAMADTEQRMYADLSRRLRRRRFFQMVGTGAAVGAGSIMLAAGLLLISRSAQH